jgi:hypothetical protein
MITVSIKFPTPARYGYGVTGQIKITKLRFPPASRAVQQLSQNYNAAGKEQTIKNVLPKPLRYIQSLRYNDSAEGKDYTVTIALPKTLRYFQSLRNCYSAEGKEHRAAIVFPKTLLYRQQLSWRYKSQEHKYNASILFPKQLRYVQKLHYGYLSKENGYTLPLILNHVRNYQRTKILYRYDAKLFTHIKLNFRYDYKNIIGTKLLFTFDRITRVETKWLWQHSFLTRSGWKIMARDTATGHVDELGFIDAENPERLLADIKLPEGDYEIFVLTSSFFWKDCQDRNIRLLAIRNGKEIAAFPNIYNVRSSVSQGITVIEWSANQCETNDYLFGIWYSSETPVDTNYPPETTVPYYVSQTEYRTIFQQKAPIYMALAAIGTGKEPEIGKIHELALNWNNTPPRAPDDVLVLNTPLPARDQNSDTKKWDDQSIILWN